MTPKVPSSRSSHILPSDAVARLWINQAREEQRLECSGICIPSTGLSPALLIQGALGGLKQTEPCCSA